MMDKENRRIDIISGISSELVDEATAERISAKQRVRKRKRIFISAVSIAASFLIFFSVLIPILLFSGGTVPVYKGMTVSKESPFSTEAPLSELMLLAANKPTKDKVKDYFDVNPTDGLYYARPGEDIYITVNFNNPEKYDILSFTLNGEKYTSYMFEEGSDMENIVLKVNVGDASGKVSYTIDEIKYIDKDNKIKDVKIGGDRTVDIGVYNENQPTAAISGVTYDASSLDFTASVADPAALIASTNGKLYAVLCDGDVVIKHTEISVGDGQSLSFDGLTPTTEYTVAIVAVFDAYDGNGEAPYVLCEESFTPSVLAFASNISVAGNSVSFDIFRANDTVTVSKVELVDLLGTVVAESDAPVTGFDGIPGGKLRIRISYSYVENGATNTGTSEVEFVCTEGMLPLIGTISAHYYPYPIMYPFPISEWTSGHFGVDIVPSTENIEVYSITDGVVTDIVTMIYNPEQNRFRCGKIEILDSEGVYHYYRFLNTAELSVGDEIKAGDFLGTLCDARESDMTIEAHLHYETYTYDGDVKVYRTPSFDTEEEAQQS